MNPFKKGDIVRHTAASRLLPYHMDPNDLHRSKIFYVRAVSTKYPECVYIHQDPNSRSYGSRIHHMYLELSP